MIYRTEALSLLLLKVTLKLQCLQINLIVKKQMIDLSPNKVHLKHLSTKAKLR